METYAWYSQLIKPVWAPPAWVFGPVWTVLYIGIFLSFGAVFWMAFTGKIPKKIIVPFLLNLVTNAAFTPLQFGLRSNLLASVDILLVLGTLIWAMKTIYPHAHWITWAQLPYMAWVSFATCLQLTITYLNIR
jgi:tryptophan-rich sensory protein